MSVVVTNIRRAARSDIDALAAAGVATAHEAQGRTGLLDPGLRPIQSGVRLAGSAVTVSVPAGDNWMLHVAVEQCREGDIVVVAPSSPCDSGHLGELLACSLMARGVRALVIDAGVRDVNALRAMGFCAWARFVSARGTVKQRLGNVNMPVVCAGASIAPGDAIVADDDGVCVIPFAKVSEVARACAERDLREAQVRERLRRGELGLDVYGMRARLADCGLVYRDSSPDD